MAGFSPLTDTTTGRSSEWRATGGAAHVLALGGSVSGALTLTVSTVTNAGTVAAGARSVGFAVTGAGPAIIAGASVPSGTSFAADAPGIGTIGAITYDATGTTLVITTLTGGVVEVGSGLPDGILIV